MFRRIGKNDPCWCGSGKPYCECHMAFDQKISRARFAGHEVPSHKIIKTPAQIEGIRESGKLNVAVLDYVAEHIRAGITTEEIDQWVYDFTTKHGGIPAPLNSSRMFLIGNVDPEKEKLVRVTNEAVEKGLEQVKPWGFLGDMGQAVHDYAKKNGYTIVEEVGGHGVGLEFHEDPFVSYVTRRGEEMLMAPGMIFTIEPMINMGRPDIFVDDSNGWTIYTDDRLPSAQREIMVLVTETGHEVLAW